MRPFLVDPQKIFRAVYKRLHSICTLPQCLIPKLQTGAALVGPRLRGKDQVERTVNGFQAKLGMCRFLKQIPLIAVAAPLSQSHRIK